MDAHTPPASKDERLRKPLGLIEEGEASVNCGFTWMQIRELEQQWLIYSYLEAGIPIPTSLILPIWRSFPSSLAHKFYPNLLHFDLKSRTEAEPGRCRRTDGKKWRCSKSVVKGHKYCHSHLNRGRLRPKNHVQPAAAKDACSSSDNSSETHLYMSLIRNDS